MKNDTAFPKPMQPLRHTSRMESRAAREATWAALQRDLAREQTPIGRLRALRTRTRVALVAAAALAPAAAMAVRHQAPLELAHAVASALVVALAAVLLAALSKPRRPARRALFGVLAALSPLAIAVIAAQLGAASHTPGHEPSAASCFILGAAYSAPAFLLALFASRTRPRNASEIALLAGLCGISACLMLDLHCPSQQLAHLLLGHALVGAAWAAAHQAAAIGSASSSGRSNTSTMSKMS